MSERLTPCEERHYGPSELDEARARIHHLQLTKDAAEAAAATLRDALKSVMLFARPGGHPTRKRLCEAALQKAKIALAAHVNAECGRTDNDLVGMTAQRDQLRRRLAAIDALLTDEALTNHPTDWQISGQLADEIHEIATGQRDAELEGHQ